MSILGNNDGSVVLEDKISELQEQISNLSSQLGNYDNSTLEGSQSIEALNDRIGQYQNAVNQYSMLLNDIRSSTANSMRSSAMKEQAGKGYIQGLATKRGMTHAEAMKDMADISGAGVAERSAIRAEADDRTAGARAGLSDLHMRMSEQEANIALARAKAGGSSGGSGGYSSGSSALDKIYDQLMAMGITPEMARDIIDGKQDVDPKSASWLKTALQIVGGSAAVYFGYKQYKKIKEKNLAKRAAKATAAANTKQATKAVTSVKPKQAKQASNFVSGFKQTLKLFKYL